jgi:hypothetical protein
MQHSEAPFESVISLLEKCLHLHVVWYSLARVDIDRDTHSTFSLDVTAGGGASNSIAYNTFTFMSAMDIVYGYVARDFTPQ